MLLGIDYGEKNIGIATSSENGELAFPENTFKNKEAIKKIKELCFSKKVGAIVLGQSTNFSGQHNPIMKKILKFKKQLEEEIGLPVFWEPEFLTTKEASQIQGRHKNIDASAAAIILQSFLDKKNNASLANDKL